MPGSRPPEFPVRHRCVRRWPALFVALATLAAMPAATAHEGAPRFELPFACGQIWDGATYTGHGTDDLAIDFNQGEGSADLGAPVVASASGIFHRVVNEVGGNSSNLDHGQGWITIYAHLDSYAVADGTPVARGQVIGYVGSTGSAEAPHLHYEQRQDDVSRHIAFSGIHIGTDGSPDPDYSYIYNGPGFTSRNCGRDPVPAPSVASLGDEAQLFAAITEQGKLVTRLQTADGWVRKTHRGDLAWRNVTVFSDRGKRLWLVGVDSTRAVRVRRWTPAAGWKPFVTVATGWSQDTTPSVALRPGGGISLVGVDTSRNLEQFDWTASKGWSSATDHGGGWERATLATARGRQWLIAVQPDGDVLTRSRTAGAGWSEFERFGTGDWAVSVPPSAAVRRDGTLSVFMVKADGRLYQRNWKDGVGWKKFWQRGFGESWLSVQAAYSDGVVGYVGQTYDRRLVSGFWRAGEGWAEGVAIGGPEWSALRPAGFGARARGGLTLLAVTSEGELFHRHWTASAGWFERFGRPGGGNVWANA